MILKADNLRQERELKAILNNGKQTKVENEKRPKGTKHPPPVVKFDNGDQHLILKFEFDPLTDTQLAEINRAENEKGGMTLCVGEACNVRRKGRMEPIWRR
jgi:hypothetical protein